MTKETIATDIDEVLFPFIQEFSAWHNIEYGTQLTVNDFGSYELEEALGVSIPETVHRIHNFTSQDHKHLDVSPLPLAQDAIATLSDDYRLVAITSRHPSFRDSTFEYLARYFRGIVDVTLIGHKETVATVKSKSEVCREIGALVLIDDSADHIQGCIDTGIGGVLFGDYSWQTQPTPHGAVRARNWPEVLEVFYGKG